MRQPPTGHADRDCLDLGRSILWSKLDHKRQTDQAQCGVARVRHSTLLFRAAAFWRLATAELNLFEDGYKLQALTVKIHHSIRGGRCYQRRNAAHLWQAVTNILCRDCLSRYPLNRKRAPMLSGVKSTLSSRILMTMARTDVGSSGMTYLHGQMRCASMPPRHQPQTHSEQRPSFAGVLHTHV